MSLESGRYMETVGWMSADLDHKNSKKNITFSRRYLDPNRVTYEVCKHLLSRRHDIQNFAQFHTRTRNASFDTFTGKTITKGLLELAEKFDLNFKFGTAPNDFTIDR